MADETTAYFFGQPSPSEVCHPAATSLHLQPHCSAVVAGVLVGLSVGLCANPLAQRRTHSMPWSFTLPASLPCAGSPPTSNTVMLSGMVALLLSCSRLRLPLAPVLRGETSVASEPVVVLGVVARDEPRDESADPVTVPGVVVRPDPRVVLLLEPDPRPVAEPPGPPAAPLPRGEVICSMRRPLFTALADPRDAPAVPMPRVDAGVRVEGTVVPGSPEAAEPVPRAVFTVPSLEAGMLVVSVGDVVDAVLDGRVSHRRRPVPLVPGAVGSKYVEPPVLDVVVLLVPPGVEPVVEADLRVRPPEGPTRGVPLTPTLDPEPRVDVPREVDEPDPVDEVSSVPVGAVLVEMICDRRRPLAAVMPASVV